MRSPARLALPLLLAALAGCQSAGPQVTVAQPSGRDDGQVTAADLAAVPGDLASNPIRLDGLSPRVVRAALGSPSFRRRDKGVEIWQYYGEGCVLDLFIYDKDDQQRGTHHQIRAVNGQPVTGCFSGIVASRGKPQTS